MWTKVSGFAAFVRLIGRSIGGIIMKRIKNRSLFIAMLSAFALSSCQDMPEVGDSLGNVEASSYTQSTTCSGGTSVPENSSSTYPEIHIRDMDNGDKLFRENYQYKQAGVILGQLQQTDSVQLDLFATNQESEITRHKRLMKAIDGINKRFGRNHIHFAVQGTETEIDDQPAGFMRPTIVESLEN